MQSTGQVWLRDLRCTGSEANLLQFLHVLEVAVMKRSLHYFKIGKVRGKICKHCKNFQMETLIENDWAKMDKPRSLWKYLD